MDRSIVILVCVSLVACTKDKAGSSSTSTTSVTASAAAIPTAPSAPAGAFAGQWSCTADMTYKYSSPAGRPDRSFKAASTWTVTQNGAALQKTEVGSNGKSSGCVIKFTANGNTATADPGQTCPMTTEAEHGETVATTESLTGATLNLAGDALTETFTDTLTGSVTKAGNVTDIKATGVGSRTCKRK